MGSLAPFWAAAWTVLALALRQPARSASCSRLMGLGASGQGGLVRIGLAAVISSLSAYLRNGGGLVGAFEEQAGRSFATRRVSYARARAMLDERRLPQETNDQVEAVAYALVVACRLSVTLGCEASRCLEAVGSAYRRMARLAQAKAAAFAMPKATVKLLTALPLLTLAFGSLLGARPLSFLLKPGAGTLCLALGGSCYLLGLLWMRALLRDLDDKAAQ